MNKPTGMATHIWLVEVHSVNIVAGNQRRTWKAVADSFKASGNMLAWIIVIIKSVLRPRQRRIGLVEFLLLFFISTLRQSTEEGEGFFCKGVSDCPGRIETSRERRKS